MIPNEVETKKMLDAEPKHTVRIRKDENNPSYVTEMVTVNGLKIQIPVGEDVEVPDTVYKRLIAKRVI